MIQLTKAASGVKYGDVCNLAIRNILSEISLILYGKFTSKDMEDTLNYFEWKCPYTGEDIRESINKQKGYATDHIVPQNKENCGLNVKGNLVFVSQKANNAKGRLSAKDFLLNDSLSIWAGVSRTKRENRLAKIQRFQEECNYNAGEIRDKIHPLLEKYYDETRIKQENRIKEIINATKLQELELPKNIDNDINPANTKRVMPKILLDPNDEDEFKEELIRNKNATIILTYDTGRVEKRDWDASKITQESNIINNIQSKTFWRTWRRDGLIQVDVLINQQAENPPS